MTVKIGTIAAMLMVLSVGGCGGLWGDDQFSRYAQRTDAITPDGGNAKEVNAITHMYHPWPPGVYDRQIVTDSPRLQRALDRYRKQQRPYDPLPRHRRRQYTDWYRATASTRTTANAATNQPRTRLGV